METNPIRVCELLVGLPEVNVLGVADGGGDEPIRVHVECRLQRPACSGCGRTARVKERPEVELVDLPAFGRPVRLVWRKHRWQCPDPRCGQGSWTVEDRRIAAPRLGMTDRAGRWATWQVGKAGRTVSEVARELGCDWHTVNDTVIAYGEALVDDDPERIGQVTALGLDETLFCRLGRWRTQQWATSIVDVAADGGARLLDMVPGRNATGASQWIKARSEEWRAGIRFGVLDLPGPYRKTFDDVLGHVIQIADPFHLVRLANRALDDCRRRVQNQTLGHRGRRDDPLYRARRLLTKAHERFDERGETRLLGLLEAGDPWPGTPKKSSAPSTPSATPTSRRSSSPSSAATSKTTPAHPKSTPWAAPSDAGTTRSSTGIGPASRTDPPRRSTT